MSNNSSSKKPFYKKWWFWVIIIAVVALVVLFFAIPSGSESNKNTASNYENELTLDQNLALLGLGYSIEETTQNRLTGSTDHGDISKKNCQLIREAVKSYDADATFFSESFCNGLSMKAKDAATDSGNIYWLTDGKNVAKIETKEVDNKTYIASYEFVEFENSDGYETIEILAD